MNNIRHFFCLLFGKIPDRLQKYHILMLNMGSNRNHFCNLELIESKAYTTSTYIPILLSDMVWYIQKIRITCNLRQNCRDKIENLFLNEKTLTTKLDHIEH